MLEETNRNPDPNALNPRDMARNYAQLLRTPVFVGHMLALALVFSGLMAFVTASPFLFIEALGIRPAHYGLLSAFAVLGTLSGNLSAGSFTMRLGIERMMWIGIGIALAAGTAMTVLAIAGFFGILVILVPIILFLCGMGIVMPNGMAGALAPFPRMAGAASALLGFVQMAVGAAASVVSGWLPHNTQLPLACLMLGLALSAAIAYGTLRRSRAGTAS
jgi:DHA1 family bicyclomycin/chloramphenicol resistance-like MFS transporter